MSKRAFGQMAGRLIALFMAGVLFVGAAGQGFAALVNGVAEFAHQRQKPGHYTERPRPIPVPKNPFRDETREKWWTPKAREAWNDFLFRQRLEDPGFLYAMVTGNGLSFLQGGGYEGGGDVTPGEGSEDTPPAPGSPGGVTNTATGNKLSEYPIVSWSGLGQNGVDFTLFHNSITGYANGAFGKGWSHSYNDFIVYTPGQQAILHRADGLVLPYNEFEGAFIRPIGIYDSLVKNQNGTFTLTTHGQWKQEFSSGGLLTSVRDRNGNAVTIIRDSFGKITEITDSSNSNRSVTFSYSGGRVSQVADPLGRVWQFSYTGDFLTGITYPQLNSQEHTRTFTYSEFALQVGKCGIATETDLRGKVWSWTYEGSTGKLLTEKDPLNNVTNFAYSGSTTTITLPNLQTILHTYNNGSLQSERDEANFVESYLYDYNLNITKLTDKRGKEWIYTYDARGNVLTEKNPLDKIWTNTYSIKNDLLSAKDPLNNITVYNHDANGNLLTVTDPLGKVVLICLYDGNGQLTSAVNATGETVNLNYNSRGDITQGTTPSGNTIGAAYDLLGRTLSQTDTAGNTTGINYDAWGRVTSVAHPDTSTIGVVYNLESMVTSVTNELNKTSSAQYDDVGQVVATTNAKNESQTYAYNQNGWLISVTNARNYARNYTYTPRGEVASLTLPDNSVEAWSYNANGELTAYTNPLSQVIGYVYDNAGRLITVDYPSGTDTALSYDNANRTTQMVDATGNTTWTYDAASRVTQLATPQGSQSYAYDDAGRRTSMTEPGSAVTNYAYDAFGRLTTITNPFSEVTQFVYDNAGRVSSKKVASNAYETYSYDNRNRVTNIAVKEQQGAVINSEAYTFDAASNVLSHTQNGLATSYGYDNIGQLITESKPNYAATYSYDSNGNRLTRTVNGTTEDYAYDGADKLETVKVGGTNIKSFGYDNAGRRTSMTTGVGTTSYNWSYDNRLTGINYPNTTSNSYAYNAVGTRVSANGVGGTKTFRRDGVGVTSPLLNDGANAITPGVSSRESGVTKFMHGGLKNSTAQSNSGQSITGTKTFDAFGYQLASAGSWTGMFGYGGAYGYQTDDELKLLGNRYYDSSIGRFITRDPIKDGRNWYSYCENNPVSNSDPTGKVLRQVSFFPGSFIQNQRPGVRAGNQARAAAVNPAEYRRRHPGHGGPYRGNPRGAPLYTDCAVFVGDCYDFIPGFPQEGTDQIDAWLRGGQTHFDEVPNDENYVPQSGDIWITPATTNARRERVPGHVIIVGSDGNAYDASLGNPPNGHGPRQRRNRDRTPNNNVPPGMTIWRPR